VPPAGPGRLTSGCYIRNLVALPSLQSAIACREGSLLKTPLADAVADNVY
jgi:hypothetical protein